MEQRNFIGPRQYGLAAGRHHRRADGERQVGAGARTGGGVRRHDHQRRQPAGLSRPADPDARGPTRRRWRGCRTVSTAFSMPPSAARPGGGASRRSARSPRRIAPGACRSWSAAPGCICARCSDGLAAIPPIPPAIRAEAAALYEELGGAAFRERLARARSGRGGAAAARRPAAADARLRGGARHRNADRRMAAAAGRSRRRIVSPRSC